MGKRILFVDDEDQIRQIVKMILRSTGFEVDCVSNGEDALDHYNNNHYSLLITDKSMPGMTGLELIQEIRSKDTELPIILCSGEDYDVSELLNVSIMKKPITTFELSNIVTSILRQNNDK